MKIFRTRLIIGAFGIALPLAAIAQTQDAPVLARAVVNPEWPGGRESTRASRVMDVIGVLSLLVGLPLAIVLTATMGMWWTFLIVLGVFVASFSIALISHAPGGLGVLEFTFLKAMPDAPQANVVAALLVFRLLYLIVPLLFALIVVLDYERRRWRAPVATGGVGPDGSGNLD